MDFLFFYHRATVRLRALFYDFILHKKFYKVGRNFKFLGGRLIKIGDGCTVGDNCWFQAVSRYNEVTYHPSIELGDRVMCSDAVHITSILEIKIGNDTLIGSNVYIGDHSHGPTRSGAFLHGTAPALRPLSEQSSIYIGKRVWIGDGVVILAGTYLADDCIVGANSVVKGTFQKPVILAGAPAKIIRNIE